MYRFIESIRIENGEAPLLFWHQKRLTACMRQFFPGIGPHSLESLVSRYRDIKQPHKLRIVYDRSIREISCTPYYPGRIEKFHLADAGAVSYDWKYADRSIFQEIKKGFPESDELILVKDGLVTDTSYANLAFHRGGYWYTPALPLLRGVRMTYLIKKGMLHPRSIPVDTLRHYDKFCQINAMLPIDETIRYEVSCIEK
ncbi:MAG: aminotransferase class IV [Bacteroidota bacterium]